MPVPMLPEVDDLTNARSLEPIFGPILFVHGDPLLTAGFSGASRRRLLLERAAGDRVSLVLKRVRPAAVWTSYRTGDLQGREALLLVEPSLAGVWDMFDCPYRAFSMQPEEIGLLMDDLTP